MKGILLTLTIVAAGLDAVPACGRHPRRGIRWGNAARLGNRPRSPGGCYTQAAFTSITAFFAD